MVHCCSQVNTTQSVQCVDVDAYKITETILNMKITSVEQIW